MKRYLKVYRSGKKNLNAKFILEEIPFSIWRKIEDENVYNNYYAQKNGIYCSLSIRMPQNIKLPMYVKNKNFKIDMDEEGIKRLFVKAKVNKLTHGDILRLSGKHFEINYKGVFEDVQVEFRCMIPKHLLYDLNNILVKEFRPKKINKYKSSNNRPYLGGGFSPK